MNNKGFDLKYKRDIAGYLGINRSTLYNWKRDKPNLYKTVMLGLKVDDFIEKSQNSLNEIIDLKKELEEKT